MDREDLILRFLEAAGWANATRSPLAGDASFRRYERLRRGTTRAVLMDAPPPQEDIRPYLQIARCLSRLGYSAPDILTADESNGLAVIEDLGDESYTHVLAAGGDEKALYELALDLLIDLHRQFQNDRSIAIYDDERFLDEAVLFVDWYLPAIRGGEVAEPSRNEFLQRWRELLAVAREVPTSLVLRDYHVDNLMLLKDREDLRACGLLDFQDAVVGPVTYDIVSLLEDARRDVSPQLSDWLISRYLDAFPKLDCDTFHASYAVMGAQRNMKIIGIFTRLDRRDHKPLYLRHVARVWRWLHGDLAHPVLAPIGDWLDRELPVAERRQPDPLTVAAS
jgi:hypothetical protein